MIWSSASRCSGVARSSMMGWMVPLPSCNAPGKSTVTANRNPSRPTSPKWPSAMFMATRPWHDPLVGRALKSHGQP
jgi:hypothetical protein